jgi:enamine deaminase RidA (YjgF/YER057c/UK114 family)
MTTLSKIHEVYPSSRQATAPLGLRVNDMVIATELNGFDLNTGQYGRDLRGQFIIAMNKIRSLVERAGGTLDNVARAVAYVTSIEDRPTVNGDLWHEVFPDPDDRPAYKVLLADLPEGELIRLDALALLGATRRRIDLPNISAFDPTVVIGNLVISSRCHGNDKDHGGELVSGGLHAEVRQTFSNLRELVTLAGGSPENIVQINTYSRESNDLDEIRAAFDEVFQDNHNKPVLNCLVNFVSARMQVAADMVAVLRETYRGDDAA